MEARAPKRTVYSVGRLASSRCDLLLQHLGEAASLIGRGRSVVTTVVVSAVTFAMALGNVLRVSVGCLRPVSPVRAAIVYDIDQLSVMGTASQRLYPATLPRVFVSSVIASMTTEILVLWCCQPKLVALLQADVQRAHPIESGERSLTWLTGAQILSSTPLENSLEAGLGNRQ